MFRIIDIAREISSGITPLRSNSEYWENGTIPWLKTEQIGEYRIKTTNEFVTEKALESTGLKLYPKNTISIAMYGEGKTRGNVSIIDCPMTTNQACCNIVVNESIVAPFYLYYFFKTQYHNLRQLSSGVRKNLNTNDIKNYLINLPNKITQQNIVNFLCSIDEKIELNNKINLELEKIAKTLYEYWFVQFDFPDENERPYKSSGGTMVYNEVLRQEIPLGWSVNNVKSCITHINTGLNPRDNFILNNGDIKYITVKNLTTHGGIDFSNCDTIDEVAKKIVHKRSDISKGDILFASIAPLGRCYLIQEEPQTWDINESVFSIRPKNTMPSEYLYMFLMSETFVKKAENSSTGSVFAGIRIKTLEDMLLAIPDNKILQLFKEKTSKILLQKHIKECENQELTTIRDFLLPMLMNGQVVIP